MSQLILVVEDSQVDRLRLVKLLEGAGYRVCTAANGLEAIALVQQQAPALILMDVNMPQMDGFDLLRNIRNDPSYSDLPVIMITSRTADKHREHAQQLGATDFLGKPYQEERLLELVGQYARSCAPASDA